MKLDVNIVINALVMAGAISSAATLSACGGGDGGGDVIVDPAPGCPRAQLADAWINNRLACLSPGQTFVDLSRSATGTPVDRAFVIGQTTLDRDFRNVLPAGASRHFQHFVCVRGAPGNVRGQSVATDLAVAIGTSNSSATKPPQVSAISLDVAGGDRPGWVDRACDPALHPVIVNFQTGRIESVNAAALSQLQVYDL